MADFSFYQNKDCGFFPCHKMKEEEFNCLFCYCPLYLLKEDCGGNYVYLENGVKDCSNCTLPHIKGKGYMHVMNKMALVMERASKEQKE